MLDLAGRVHYGFYHAGVAHHRRRCRGARAAWATRPRFFTGEISRRCAVRSSGRTIEPAPNACAPARSESAAEARQAFHGRGLGARRRVRGGRGRRRPTRACARACTRARRRQPAHWARRGLGHDSRPQARDAAERDAVSAKLTSVVEAFDAWEPALDDPDWGEAEALPALAAAALERGQARTARDFIERALLIAPDYRAALTCASRCRAHAAAARRNARAPLRSAPRWYSIRAVTEQLGLVRIAPRPGSRRARTGAAQRSRKPAGTLSDAAPAAASYARARRASRHASFGRRCLRPREPTLDRGRPPRARAMPPAAPRGIVDVGRALAIGRRWDIEYRSRPQRPVALPCGRIGARGFDAGRESARCRRMRCEVGSSTKPTIT